MNSQQKPAKPAAVPQESVPDAPQEWLVSTPVENTYELEMFGDDGQSVQTISMTRDEYISLKLHLAKLRGLTIPESRPKDKNGFNNEQKVWGFYIDEGIWNEVDPDELKRLGVVGKAN
jgi:hypothetical protein